MNAGLIQDQEDAGADIASTIYAIQQLRHVPAGYVPVPPATIFNRVFESDRPMIDIKEDE